MAQVDLDAVQEYQTVDPVHGALSGTIVLQGPVLLRKEGGAWKVASLTRAGRSTLDYVFLSPEGTSKAPDGITVRVIQAELHGERTTMIVEIANGGSLPVRFGPVRMSVGLSRAEGYVDQGLTVAPGDTHLGLARVPRAFPLSTRTVRLRLLKMVAPEGPTLPAQGLKVVLGRPSRDRLSQ